MTKILIVILTGLLVWFATAIVRLESYNYAAQLGFCEHVERIKRHECLNNVQTRTNPFWHLLYGLKVL
jgi:hypothetical protein